LDLIQRAVAEDNDEEEVVPEFSRLLLAEDASSLKNIVGFAYSACHGEFCS
jgi:hypothetical protein